MTQITEVRRQIVMCGTGMTTEKRCHETQHIDQHIRQTRELLVRESERLPNMHNRLRDLQQRRRVNLESPALISTRIRANLDCHIESLSNEIRRIESGEHLRAFESDTLPYLEAYQRCAANTRRRLEVADTLKVPGEPTRVCFRQTTGVDGGRQQTEIISEFLCNVTPGGAPRARVERNEDACPRCNITMSLVPTRAILVCPNCGSSSTFLDATAASMSFDDSSAMDYVVFSYKRSVHFGDWLQQAQGVETYCIPQSIQEAVMDALYRQRVRDINVITPQLIRDTLKSLKDLRKYYEHSAKICTLITGRAPQTLPNEAVELCKLLFVAIQAPFQRHATKVQRKNMLSYSYLISKMLFILGFDELAASLSLLKSREKLRKMDEIWSAICAELDLPFYSSV